MTESQQKGLAFILSSSKDKKIEKPQLESGLIELDRRDNRILIKDSNKVVQQVITEEDEDNNYGDIVELMRAIRNDKNKD